MLVPIIMAGGTGSRLWPLSRDLYPKQFLKLTGDESMLEQTVTRLQGLEHQDPILICNEEHRFIAAEQMRLGGFSHSGIILEPVGRNTAPAIALAALQALKQFEANPKNEEPMLLVLAADHVIKDEAAFCESIEKAVPFAQADKLVTFGIVPITPETGYGYIKRGEVQGDNAGFRVAQFVEKPNLATAQDYLASGEYYWNSGMFLFKASTYLAELKAHRPDMFSACEQAMAETQADLDFIRVDKAAFEACPDDSIDYAVMEKTTQAVVVAMDCGWSDVGSWSALWEVSDKDEYGNACRGDVINLNTRNTYVHATEKLVTTIGLDDLVIVETKDAILVAKQSEVQQVKKIVDQLKIEERREWQHHREVYRPWGKYDSIDNGDRFQVKRITVKPGEKLSIQMHHHRAEHWIIVTGTAKVTNGDKELLLTENQSTYIPVGVIHALENPGKVPLELIEVQSGSYLGEDDIVRFEDRYGRIN
ncbi:mannose-1-phosphate guanylyltransferase/mannose-6-phosphate isomerase [Shewanella acanthi]|uniref:mannose-1-phosphate guanylyltransferase/mannose-6-phosphate isomerase n=1 Tax=Shewanella acanthi TaxID=2864212 RepID=UPI002576F0DD|nr:mannose-1-phosphate guanylyltransferase/mannose-6-phosphate isomerase [Shewanella acanthi]